MISRITQMCIIPHQRLLPNSNKLIYGVLGMCIGILIPHILLSQRLDPKINTSCTLLIKQCMCVGELFSPRLTPLLSLLIWAMIFLTLILFLFLYSCLCMWHAFIGSMHLFSMPSLDHGSFLSWHTFLVHIFYSIYFCIAHIS